MIPTKEREVEIASNVTGEEIRMTIDENAMEHLVGILTDLYSDPEMAVIREISCNAYDAHVAAGNSDPINVTLPTSINPTFIVQDWGIGLDADDFRNIYSKYGTSTKRETNDQIGSLGLGCKSPLTYTNQFTVTGVKDGVRTSALITRDENNMPVLTIVDQQPSDLRNGVTVSVVVSTNFYNFEEKARKFFSFWKPGTILLNGEEPQKHKVQMSWDNVDVYQVVDRYTSPVSYVVMGNVPYPIDESKFNFRNLLDNHGFIVNLPMGAVHFTPSREELHYTKRTKEAISVAYEAVKEEVVKWIEEDIVDQPTKADTIRRLIYWRNQLRYNANVKPDFASLKRDGKPIPQTLRPDTVEIDNPDDPTIELEHFGATPGSDRLKDYGMHLRVKLDFINCIWVQGFDRRYTITVKKKLWQYLNEHGRAYPNQFFFVKGKVTNPWIDPKLVLDWEEVDKVKLNYGRTTKTTRVTTYDGYLVSRDSNLVNRGVVAPSGLTVADIQNHGGVQLYYQGSNAPYGYRTLSADCFKVKHSLVLLRARQIDRYKRLFPTAIEYNTWINGLADQWWTGLSEDTKLSFAMGNVDYSKMFIVADIKDPELKSVVECNLKSVPERDKTIYNYFMYRFSDQLKDVKIKLDIRETYPLLSGSHSNAKHNTLYVNAVWEELNA